MNFFFNFEGVFLAGAFSQGCLRTRKTPNSSSLPFQLCLRYRFQRSAGADVKMGYPTTPSDVKMTAQSQCFNASEVVIPSLLFLLWPGTRESEGSGGNLPHNFEAVEAPPPPNFGLSMSFIFICVCFCT